MAHHLHDVGKAGHRQRVLPVVETIDAQLLVRCKAVLGL
eukprot:CAMPEP_0170278062 /NCGR_PEP_ID=MMETSP0116_2-20130129/39030_1 /TAXON_ID=400756 /ORGANISM="Durinskia baltica, Strain CSIRO CS-38" /LENGTH=38 /DNA_ID= /DNA_START= /DNA_END= /DNA_ORIENTATION=